MQYFKIGIMFAFYQYHINQDWHPPDHHSFASNAEGLVASIRFPLLWRPVLWPDHCIQGNIGAEFHMILMWSSPAIVRKGFRPKIVVILPFAKMTVDPQLDQRIFARTWH